MASGIVQDHFDGTTPAEIIGGGLLARHYGGQQLRAHWFLRDGCLDRRDGSVHDPQRNVTVSVVGTFDVVSGEFSASGPVTDATGKLAGATGNLLLEDIEDFSDGSFVEDGTGTFCLQFDGFEFPFRGVCRAREVRSSVPQEDAAPRSPPLAPHHEAMRASISKILGIPVDRVSVKATTTDHLGFTGREEGICALAIVAIELP